MGNFSKKISVGMVIFLLAFFSLFSLPEKSQALYEGEADAYCVQGVTGYWYFTSWRVLHEWWQPSHTQINEFWMYVDSTGGGTFNLEIWFWGGGLSTSATAHGDGYTYDWVGFDFNNFTVSTDDLYWTKITGDYPNRWWTHKPDDCTANYATSGVTSYGSLTYYYDRDFIFYVYGQEYQAPPEEGGPPPDAPPAGSPPADDPGGVAAGSEQPAVAAATTSSKINPPTKVAVADLPNDQGTALKLTWEKSTSSGISGYKIYRSEEENGKFTKIGIAKSTETEFTDQGLSADKKYYYVVRSYNSSSESASSDKVSASPTDNLAPATPSNLKAEYNSGGQTINLSWNANQELDLDKYILKYGFESGKMDKETEIVTNTQKHILFDIKSEQTYYFEFSAKDKSGNISAPVKTNLKTPTIAKVGWYSNFLNIYTYVGGGLIVILAGVLTFLILKRRKKLKLHSGNVK
ncbi:MAG: cell wall binding repeat 2-containing protein [Candidatus Berkelbacteria bacterium Athens1014_28]|uniref:Cell wall binding repeat 2-containing protein n=1 Tax=Candidatus Berkelbacteria bacterium Athens1014_28 TaxID=2017145 RepID=A0A554LMX2_9BACT|nr:MAG: cell wall binding repeat 2-containing protein [Candidatus Berkelbacteria bacterium Athens1014_28]